MGKRFDFILTFPLPIAHCPLPIAHCPLPKRSNIYKESLIAGENI
jgi:hypothetical protein